MAIISKERTQVLDKLLLFEIDDDEQYYLNTNQEMFDHLADSAEMHYFARDFSGEKDQTVLWLIINDKRCDKATALMVFWQVCPRFYTNFANEEEAKTVYADFIFALLKNILQNWESGFYINHRFAFDPYKSHSFEVTYISPNEKWSIPDYMKNGLEGENVTVEE